MKHRTSENEERKAGAAPYEGISEDSLIVRDRLALDRTRLANERTLLAYFRTGLALILAGASFVYFAGDSWFQGFGFVCIPLGVIGLIFGIRRFRIVNRRLSNIDQQ